MKIARVVKLDASPITQAQALALASQLSHSSEEKQRIELNDFSRHPNPFDAFRDKNPLLSTDEALGHLFFVGQTQRVGQDQGIIFSGRSADEFAQDFWQLFDERNVNSPYKIMDKSKVRHIYLIGSEVGLSDRGQNNSYAQALADALKALYFEDLRVHAIAYERAPNEKLYVIPTTSEEKADYGHLSALVLNAQRVQELALINDIPKMDAKERQARMKRQFDLAKSEGGIIAHSLPAYSSRGPSSTQVFAWSENEFIPNEDYQARRERLRKDLVGGAMHRLARRSHNRKVLAVVNGYLEQTQQESKLTPPDHQKKLEILNDLQKALMKMDQDAHSIAMDLVRSKANDLPNLGLSPLLKEISESRVPSLSAAKPNLESKSTTAAQIKTAPVASLPAPATKPAVTKNISPALSGLASLTKSNVPDEIRLELAHLIGLLNQEIKQLRQKKPCIRFFINHEINSKERKKACLERLYGMRSFDGMQTLARASLKDKGVTWHFFNTSTKDVMKSRTKNLLRKISKFNSSAENKKAPLRPVK